MSSSTARGVSLDKLCRACGVSVPVPEFQFALAAGRKWRFDWCWPREKVALEVEGGSRSGGRHTRHDGFVEDMAKYNAAALDGWLLLRVTPGELQSTTTLDLIRRALALRQHPRAAQ